MKNAPRPTIVLGIDPVLKLAAKGDLAAVKATLAAQPSLLNAMSDGHHRTLLWEAANANRLDVVEYLVERGADLNIPGRYRSETLVLLTPHCIAAKRKRKAITQYLLERGARIDVYAAAYLGAMEILGECLDQNPAAANTLHPADSAWDVVPLHYAIAGEQPAAGEYLASRTAVRPHSELLLDMACRLGRMDLIQHLVAAGADPAAAPAFSILYRGDEIIIDYFFSRGADVDKRGITNWPPIAYVSRGDKGEHPERVAALIKYGADINAAGPKGVTALHAAAKAGFVSVIELLLAAGADPEARTAAGHTPLDLAVKAKRPEAVACLRNTQPQHHDVFRG